MTRNEALRHYAGGLAALRDYPYPERVDLWLERLELNRPELELLAQAPNPLKPPYHPRSSERPEPASLKDSDGKLMAVAEAVRGGRARAVDRLAQAVARAHELRDLNAFITLADPATAGDSAAPSLASGPLAGITLAVKDLIAVRGLPRTGGSRALGFRYSNEDAPAVRRLKAAGAQVVGTANLHELGYGITSENPHYGTVGNPVCPGRIAGGSSGGSAAAVASGIADAALGTDTAGSIRVPAACCSIIGFKPSFGAVPLDGVLPLGWSLDHLGPIARTVEDVALLYDVMTGAWPARQVGGGGPNITVLRPLNYFFDQLAPAVAERLDEVFERLVAAGIRVVERTLDGIEYALGIQFATLAVEATQNYLALAERAPEGLGEDVRLRLEIGQLIPGIDYQRAQRLRTSLHAAMEGAMAGVDAIVTPTLVVPPPPTGTSTVDVAGEEMFLHTAMSRCTAPFNLTGMPAITLPCGTDAEGAPIGVQLAGPPAADARLLAVAQAVEGVLADAF